MSGMLGPVSLLNLPLKAIHMPCSLLYFRQMVLVWSQALKIASFTSGILEPLVSLLQVHLKAIPMLCYAPCFHQMAHVWFLALIIAPFSDGLHGISGSDNHTICIWDTGV